MVARFIWLGFQISIPGVWVVADVFTDSIQFVRGTDFALVKGSRPDTDPGKFSEFDDSLRCVHIGITYRKRQKYFPPGGMITISSRRIRGKQYGIIRHQADSI